MSAIELDELEFEELKTRVSYRIEAIANDVLNRCDGFYGKSHFIEDALEIGNVETRAFAYYGDIKVRVQLNIDVMRGDEECRISRK